MNRPRIHFVTGRLAEFSLRAALAPLAESAGFEYSVEVLNITVAALMTTEWIAKRIHVPPHADRVLLPGYALGDLAPIAARTTARVERGPKDLRRLPEFFGQSGARPADYGAHDIQILAEINHAPQLAFSELIAEADRLRAAGADVIDIGCLPGEVWNDVGPAVRELVARGHRVSIDSMAPVEIAAATSAGAELVLSVNSQNRHAALDWGCEVVAVPDDPRSLGGLDETIEFLASGGVPLRIDPILEPIGFGFAASLGRYLEIRRRYPDAEMLMGIGNLTELTDADSAGINVLLLGFCQEQAIHGVLTTQVAPWARSSVRECDLARRLVFHAVRHRTLPKRLEPGLVMLRDTRALEMGVAALDRLAAEIKDHNYRIFVEGGAAACTLRRPALDGRRSFRALRHRGSGGRTTARRGHACYLGYELAKATTALTLGKDYRQDEALDWGFLTRPETPHRVRRRTPLERAAPAARAASLPTGR